MDFITFSQATESNFITFIEAFYIEIFQPEQNCQSYCSVCPNPHVQFMDLCQFISHWIGLLASTKHKNLNRTPKSNYNNNNYSLLSRALLCTFSRNSLYSLFLCSCSRALRLWCDDPVIGRPACSADFILSASNPGDYGKKYCFFIPTSRAMIILAANSLLENSNN